MLSGKTIGSLKENYIFTETSIIQNSYYIKALLYISGGQLLINKILGVKHEVKKSNGIRVSTSDILMIWFCFIFLQSKV